jgi:hypothetical protein
LHAPNLQAGRWHQHRRAELLDAIATEYRKGRHLLIGTINLDVQRVLSSRTSAFGAIAESPNQKH